VKVRGPRDGAVSGGEKVGERGMGEREGEGEGIKGEAVPSARLGDTDTVKEGLPDTLVLRGGDREMSVDDVKEGQVVEDLEERGEKERERDTVVHLEPPTVREGEGECVGVLLLELDFERVPLPELVLDPAGEAERVGDNLEEEDDFGEKLGELLEARERVEVGHLTDVGLCPLLLLALMEAREEVDTLTDGVSFTEREGLLDGLGDGDRKDERELQGEAKGVREPTGARVWVFMLERVFSGMLRDVDGDLLNTDVLEDETVIRGLAVMTLEGEPEGDGPGERVFGKLAEVERVLNAERESLGVELMECVRLKEIVPAKLTLGLMLIKEDFVEDAEAKLDSVGTTRATSPRSRKSNTSTRSDFPRRCKSFSP